MFSEVLLWALFCVDPSWSVTDPCKILSVGRVLCCSACIQDSRKHHPDLYERFGFLWRPTSKKFQTQKQNFSGDWNAWELMEISFKPGCYGLDIVAPVMSKVAGTIAGTVRPRGPCYVCFAWNPLNICTGICVVNYSEGLPVKFILTAEIQWTSKLAWAGLR